MFAEVIINTAAKELNRTFDYHVPENLESNVQIGNRVLVPFGNSKRLEEAFVISFKENTEYKTKDIQKVEEGLSRENIELAKWMAKRYFCNLSDCIKLMLPPGTKTKEIQNRIKEKTANFVSLNKNKEEIEFDIENKKIKTEKQLRIINFLLENIENTQNYPTLITDLEIITDTTRAIIKTLEKNGYVQIQEKQIQRNPFINKVVQASHNLKFTNEQQHAYNEIEECMDDQMHAEFLIFGVTGSRKN